MKTLTLNPEEIFELQKKNRRTISLSSVETRLEKLERLRTYLLAHTDEICRAANADMGKPASEAIIGELSVLITEISYVKKHLRRWLKPRKMPNTLISIGTSSYIQHEAKGNVLIMSPWNYPISLPLKPLIYAIAAGCVSVIKPSEYSPFSSAFVAKLVGDLFPRDEVAVIEGDPVVSQELLQLPFDHIFFTGSTAIGKEVMKAAASHLASVTLELGGKSPSIVDQTADIKSTAELIIWGKFYNNGQTCIAPDYILVQKDIRERLIEALKTAIIKMYNSGGEGIQKSNSYGRIINEKHFNRLISLRDEAVENGAKLTFGGDSNIGQRYIEPTLLTNINASMRIMQEEIFGPLLPIIEFSELSEAVNYVNAMEKPLALYIHSSKSKNVDYILENTSSGNALVNEVLTQFGNAEVPFGGVNHSGIGKSNGYYGFQEFTNLKGVTKRRFGTIKFIYPPYGPKMLNLLKKVLPWL